MDGRGAMACEAWLREHGDGVSWGWVKVRPAQGAWELRHALDAGRHESELRVLEPAALRAWADQTDAGTFRPLKSGPGLRRGWRCLISGHGDLELALNGIHPGGLGDWWAVRSGEARPVSFGEHMGRQTGVYRGARRLADGEVHAVVRACCGPGRCIKDRRWNAGGLGADVPGAKSAVPCLEPCALAMDMARAMARMASAKRLAARLSAEDMAVVRAALERASSLPPPEGMREADLSEPGHPRRMQLLLEWLGPEWGRTAASPKE